MSRGREPDVRVNKLFGSERDNKVEVFKFQGILGRETDKAIHFVFSSGDVCEDGKDNTWFPLSQVKEIHRTRSIVNGTLDSIVVTHWIAKQKGLVD